MKGESNWGEKNDQSTTQDRAKQRVCGQIGHGCFFHACMYMCDQRIALFTTTSYLSLLLRLDLLRRPPSLLSLLGPVPTVPRQPVQHGGTPGGS